MLDEGFAGSVVSMDEGGVKMCGLTEHARVEMKCGVLTAQICRLDVSKDHV